MAERTVPAPSLTAVATPVDRFVSPLRQVAPQSNSMLEIAKALQTVNPAIQQFIGQRHEDYVKTEEAKGANAESFVDPSVSLQNNREGWKSLIDQQRQADRVKGTNNADRLAAASPHFQRGLLKARAKRMGMALNDHLASLYSRNPTVTVGDQQVNLHDVDDPAILSQWVQETTNSYTERMGLGGLDPVLVAEVFTPLASKAQDTIMGHHTNLRLERYQQDYMDEMSANAGMLLSYAGNGDSEVGDFINRLGGRESGGDYSRVNTLGYTGLLQFGEDRLADFNRAHGTSYTLEEFKDNQELQDIANHWHINDIDKVIDEEGFLAKGWSRDGLRAVAHLGGIGGMKKFVETNGEYNPKDAYGTRLSNYYTQFSGPSVDLQAMLDDAIADGIDPRKANENIVNTVINDALAKRDPTVLGVLKDINAGSGPLGNIGWVKEQMRMAEDRIADLQWQEETREYTRQERARSEQVRTISGEAFRDILSDPLGDHSKWMDVALDSGNPELVNAIRNMQNGILDDLYKVRTNHEAYADLRYRIHTSTDPQVKSQLALDILRGTGTLWGKADAESLMDALEQSERNLDVYDDDLVQQAIRSLDKAVRGRFGEKDFMGNSIGGDEEALTAVTFAYDELADWLEKNEGASKQDVRKAMRGIVQELLNSPEFTNPNAPAQPRQVGEVPNPAQPNQAATDETPNVSLEGVKLNDGTKAFLATPDGYDLLQQLATQAGMDVEEYARQQGIF